MQFFSEAEMLYGDTLDPRTVFLGEFQGWKWLVMGGKSHPGRSGFTKGVKIEFKVQWVKPKADKKGLRNRSEPNWYQDAMFGPAQLAMMGAEESGEADYPVWDKKHVWAMEPTRKRSPAHLRWCSQGVKVLSNSA